MQLGKFIPSPETGTWYLGPIPLRAYALAILIGILVAILIGDKRWQKLGGQPNEIADLAIWGVPFGIIGGRFYHVVTDPQLYFGIGRDPIDALKIWQGGLGIWGAIAFGAVGIAIGCRRAGINFWPVADALAPGIVLAQAIGRFGNYFNQELFGSPTQLPWGLEIDMKYRPDGYLEYAIFHPTFLYESVWCVIVAATLFWAQSRYRLINGQVFALYIALYSLGRFFIEQLRIDPVNAAAGFRLNSFTSLVVLILGIFWLQRLRVKSLPGVQSLYRSDKLKVEDET
jgi:prolipoprotein diacylglyceryl transferase